MNEASLNANNPEVIFYRWLDGLAEAVDQSSAQGVASMFLPDGHWKDMLGLTWDYMLFSGQEAILDAFEDFSARQGFGNIQMVKNLSAPVKGRRGGKEVVDGFFEFSTSAGTGIGFARISCKDEIEPRAWFLMTSLRQLYSAPERIGATRPSGNEFAHYMTTENWADRRAHDILYQDRSPEVLIVGAGHAALSLAARLKTMGVDVLLVEKTGAVGDSWRRRYHSLSLHNPVYANHMPYLPFPDTWQTWLPKDKLAGWLEAYAETMELNVWTGTTVTGAVQDDKTGLWTVTMQGDDGQERQITCRELVLATGVTGVTPRMPALPGIENFEGELVHSSRFCSGGNYKGKRALVIGTGNSGHDVAQDLVVNGTSHVAMLQRGPTCVVSLEPTASTVFAVYSGGSPVDELDLMAAAIPYPVLVDTYRWMVSRARENDQELLEGLHARGFRTYYGPDDTGFHMMYLRGEGGFYIDVGNCRLIIEGKVDIVSCDDLDCFVSEGIRLKNGKVVEFDLVVAATGFLNMQEDVRRLLGDEVAERVGPVWGMDEHYAMRNIWRRTAQPHFWLTGGGLVEARMFSRMLSLQIAASLRCVLPPKQ